MKKLLFVIALLFAVDVGSAQIREMWTADTSAGTTWKTYTKGNQRNIFQVEISNDTTAGSEMLYVALSATDTSANRRFPLLYGETLFLESIQVSGISIRASSGSIPYRIRFY